MSDFLINSQKWSKKEKFGIENINKIKFWFSFKKYDLQNRITMNHRGTKAKMINVNYIHYENFDYAWDTIHLGYIFIE